MDKKTCNIQETVYYEPRSLFLLHNNFSDNSYTNHWHNAVEVIMPIQNSYSAEINHQPYTLNEFDILIIPSGELHQLNMDMKKGRRIILQFSLETLNTIHGFINSSYVYSKPQLITCENAPELHENLKQLLLEMQDEYLNRHSYYEVAVTHKIIGLTLQLARKWQDDRDLHYVNLSKRKEHIERLNECLDYIEHHYNENLTLDIAAQSIGYSKFHFSRWFREFANMSFLDYLTKIRIDKAEALLMNSKLSMTEIAMEVGFHSTNTLNRVFRKHKNCTPTEYRYMHFLKEKTALMHSNPNESHKTTFAVKTPTPYDVPGFSPTDAVCRKDETNMYHNPIIWADVPDPDVIRVGDTYYMVSTTMYFCPGIPIMKSYDLVHWQIIQYAYDILDDSPPNALRGGSNAYGKGSWAASIRYHKDIFYITAASFTTNKTYIFQTHNLENGCFDRYELNGVYHDPSLLFDDDDRVYIVYGGGQIRLKELTHDAKGLLRGGTDKVIIEKANAGGNGGLPAEGAHIYKIDGKYCLFLIAWPPKGTRRRIQLCYTADAVEGPYEGSVILDDDMGYNNNGVAQGGVFDTADNRLYAMLFQDHGAVGRVPVLLPAEFDGKMFVINKNNGVPKQIKPLDGRVVSGGIVASDEFYPYGQLMDYSARNTVEYRCGSLGDRSDENESTAPDDNELIINNRFEENTSNWGVMEIAEIEMTEDEMFNNAPVLFVSGRATTASGPLQNITSKVRHSGVYEAAAYVKYTVGPPEKVFNICIRNGVTWEGIRIMGSGKLAINQWGLIRGTYTIPENADLTETSIFIETEWTEKPRRENDLMDFYVGFVSVSEKPLLVYSEACAGENDPNGSSVSLVWQWNHNPNHNLWSMTERRSFLRLKTAHLCRGLLEAKNTLTQRTFGPVCSGICAIETDGLKDGDVAGLAALQEQYGFVGVKIVNGDKYIITVNTASGQQHKEEVPPHILAGSESSILITQNRIYLRVDFDFEKTDTAWFFYSLDELTWHSIGEPLPLKYKLSHFTGYRFALFCYATQHVGGYADFDYFRLSDSLMVNNENLTVLSARLDESTETAGIPKTKITVRIHMDAPSETVCMGYYLSFPIPDILDVDNVLFNQKNVKGDTNFTVNNRQLTLTATGDCVSFRHAASDVFAEIVFTVNNYVTEDTVIIIQPDYIYTDDDNTAYNIHNTHVFITLTAPFFNTAAKKPGLANPIISHKYGADPWAIEYNGRVYMYLTGDAYEYDEFGKLTDNTYRNIKTINVISSADLLNWTDHGAIIAAGEKGAAKWAAHSWAPCVAQRLRNGKNMFYLYFANDTSNIGVLESETPLGPWKDPLNGPLIHQGIPGIHDITRYFDPAVLVDDDGKAYLYFGGGPSSCSDENAIHPRTAHVIRLSDDMTGVCGSAVVIDAPAFFEDSGIHKYNGKYYYSYCSNFIGKRPHGYPPHGQIAYMTSTHPTGPFTYEGIILKNPYEFFGIDGNNRHCVFSFKNDWYIAYHTQTLAQALGKAKGYRSPHINRLSYSDNTKIRPVTPDMKGVTHTSVLNPYERTEAACFAWSCGITVTDCGFNTQVLTHIHNNDWVAVANVDFGCVGETRFSASLMPLAGGYIEIRLDSTDGDIIGQLGAGTAVGVRETRFCEIKPVTGIRSLFFLFKGDSEDELFIFIDWQLLHPSSFQ